MSRDHEFSVLQVISYNFKLSNFASKWKSLEIDILESVSEDEMQPSKNNLLRARELYEELRQMSVDTGGSIEDLVHGMSTSNESVASIIPMDKREEFARFELSLKQMIEEAKALAETPSVSHENLYRSESVNSLADSVVSVIHKPSAASNFLHPPGQQQEMAPASSPRFDQPPVRPPRTPSPKRKSSDLSPIPPSPNRADVSPFQFPSQVQQPSPRMSRADMPASTPTALAPASPVAPVKKPEPKKPAADGQPLVGADRYEEIITARARSSSRGPRSIQGSMTNLFQPGSTMAMREETKEMSMSKASLNSFGSMSKVNQGLPERPVSSMDMSSASAASMKAGPNLNGSQPTLFNGNLNHSNGSINAKLQSPGLMQQQPKIQSQARPTLQPQIRPTMQSQVKSSASLQQPQPQQPMVPVKPAFEPKPIEPSINPIRPENRPTYIHVRSSYPDWLMMIAAYAMVFVTILLLSEITPNGKLFIHFTAFWSMVLYFSIDKTDDQSTDVLDTVMENFVKVKQK